MLNAEITVFIGSNSKANVITIAIVIYSLAQFIHRYVHCLVGFFGQNVSSALQNRTELKFIQKENGVAW